MSKSILIIDDEPFITVALMTRLQARGFTVFHAINGLAGVEAAALHQPAVIILDVRMPDIDGYDACVRIKRLPGLSQTKVVFLSANNQDVARRKANEAGGDAFLSKPYKAPDILAIVEKYLNSPPHSQQETNLHVVSNADDPSN